MATKNVHPGTSHKIKRIGIILNGFNNVNISALNYLVLQMNSMQHTFEYEFLPSLLDDDFINTLSSTEPIIRQQLKSRTPDFEKRYTLFIQSLISSYSLQEKPADYFIFVTTAKFADNFYTMRTGRISVLALGNWETVMAPPSILEFILTLILRESVSAISQSLKSSIHLGTKGCLFDFTAFLGDVRHKVLSGFVCNHCRTALVHDGYPELADELILVLDRKWIGELDDPKSPASIARKLGYDLFITKGFTATPWEKFLITLQEESTKQLISIVSSIILILVLIALGLKP